VPYILGMAKVKGKVKMLLDIEGVLSTQDVHGLEQVRRRECAEVA
jgi:purine-binding chemotaxis protein CheW